MARKSVTPTLLASSDPDPLPVVDTPAEEEAELVGWPPVVKEPPLPPPFGVGGRSAEDRFRVKRGRAFFSNAFVEWACIPGGPSGRVSAGGCPAVDGLDVVSKELATSSMVMNTEAHRNLHVGAVEDTHVPPITH